MVAVKAYPAISKGHDELVCCAGVTENHEWIHSFLLNPEPQGE